MGLFDRHQNTPTTPASTSEAQAGSVAAIAAGNENLLRFLRSVSGELPGRAYVLARTISRHLSDVAADPSAELMDVGSRISLERMATTHLPDTIKAYLRARTMPDADRLLVEQLSTMEHVAADAAQRSIEAARDAFLVQGSFLADKYGATHG